MDDGKKELEIGITVDAGGGSKKVSFSLMNRTDGKLIQHILMIYEAGDTLENNIYQSTGGQFEWCRINC